MSKIFSKTLKKTTLLSVIIAVILAAAVVIGCLFGFNQGAAMADGSTLTVSVNTFAYNNDKEDIKKTCEKVFEKADASVEYVIEGEMNGDSCELVFVFDKKVDASGLTADVKTALKADFATANINVSSAKEEATAVVAKHFLLRAAISAVVFSVLAFAYVAIRYRSVFTGIAVGGSVLVSMLLTTALLILTRIPVSVFTASVVTVAGLLTSVLTVLTAGKVRAMQKENATDSNEQLLLSSIPAKESLLMGGGLAVAMLLVGIAGRAGAVWFVVGAFVAIAVSLFIALFFAPAVSLSLKTVEDSTVKKSAYVGAKKISTKKKKTTEESVAEAPVAQAPAEAEEAPVAAEETPVEGAPVQVEEPVEAPAEETPTDESAE